MILIPARLASSRFERKIVCDIFGTPMVIATAKRVAEVDRVAIATDSEEVMEIAKAYGIEAVLTREDHQSGTDRINEAADILGLKPDEVVLNVQADEPFIEPSVVQAVYDRTCKIEDEMMVSCYKRVDPKVVEDPNLVKVIIDNNANAIYFSRSKIPYDREPYGDYFGHLGIYGFRRSTLEAFCALPPAPLEQIEKLEQLRAIYHAQKIAMVEVKSKSFGIDTVEDLEKALKVFGR